MLEARRCERRNAETGKEHLKVQEHSKLRRVSRKDLRGLRELPGTHRQEAREDEVVSAARSLSILLLRCLPCQRFSHGPHHVREPGRGRPGGQGVRGKAGRRHKEDLRELQGVSAHDLRRGCEETPRKPARVLRLWGKA